MTILQEKQQQVAPRSASASRDQQPVGQLRKDQRQERLLQMKVQSWAANSTLSVLQRATMDKLQGQPVQREGALEDEELPAQTKSKDSVNSSQTASQPIQKKDNNTGLPDNLKSGIEQLSGYAMDDVKVHYNSDKPAQLNALAYAQGTDIHVAPGQEQHLPHEAWHVVQQRQGRVQPTLDLGGVPVNDNVDLEREADHKGQEALQQTVVG